MHSYAHTEKDCVNAQGDRSRNGWSRCSRHLPVTGKNRRRLHFNLPMSNPHICPDPTSWVHLSIPIHILLADMTDWQPSCIVYIFPCVVVGSVGTIYNVYRQNNDAINIFLRFFTFSFYLLIIIIYLFYSTYGVFQVSKSTGSVGFYTTYVWVKTWKHLTEVLAVCLCSVFLFPGPAVRILGTCWLSCLLSSIVRCEMGSIIQNNHIFPHSMPVRYKWKIIWTEIVTAVML